MPDLARPHHHVRDVFRWSSAARIDRGVVLLSLLATAGPLIAGLLLQRPGFGEIIALGAVLFAPEATQNGTSDRGAIMAALFPAVAAMAAAGLLARLPGAGALMIGVTTGAATLVNYSRPAAVAAVRFIVFLVLLLELIGARGVHDHAAFLFGIGVLWRAALLSTRFGQADAAPKPAESVARTPSPRQRRAHLRRQLATLQGWHYPLRLAVGLAGACTVRAMWPQHHFDWLVLSIVLMTPRTVELLPLAVTQRAVGTFAGVCLAGAVLHAALPYAVLLLVLCACGTLAPLARAGNYAAYCALSTPLILLAMDSPGPLTDGLLADRLLATLMGAALVGGANLAMAGLLKLAVRRRGGLDGP